MLRTFQLRLVPTKAQRDAFAHILLDSAETYNAALQERREAWKLQRKRISYQDQTKQLTELRAEPSFASIAIDIQREPLRRLDKAFKAFFRRCKNGQKPGYPRFRSRERYDSFAWSRPTVLPDSLRVPNIGHVRLKSHRSIEGKPKQVIIKRIGQKWVARVACDIGPAPEKRSVTNAVGIDVGLTSLLTLSDGHSIDNPRWTRKHEARIAAASRKLALKQRRSKNRIRAREALRRAYQRAADARTNYLHHVSKWLVANYDLIAHEDLKISQMAKHPTMAKSIMDAAWATLLFQLAYKAEKAGTYVVAVNPRNTSQKCSGCGQIVRKKLSERQHVCACGTELGRDHNAALNILALGRSAAGLVPSEGSV